MKTPNTLTKVLNFGALDGIYWAVSASFGAFVTAFCLDRGYEESIVSLMIALYMFCAFAGQFFWSSICDKMRTNRKVFLATILSAGILQLLMYLISEKLAFALLYGLFGFMYGPLGSIADTWMLRGLRFNMKNYGYSRSMGSAGYAIVILITGQLIRRFGYIVMPVVSSFFAALTLIIAFYTPDAPVEEQDISPITLKDILSILKIPSYLLILAVVFLMGMANSPVNSLKIMILERIGGDVANQGVDAFIGCSVQFVFFFISGAFTFIRPKIRMLLAASSLFFAIFLYYGADRVFYIYLGSILLNIMYSLMIASSKELIMEVVEPRYHTTANGLCDASYSFIAGMVSLLYAGSIAQHFGVRVMILVSLFMAIAAVLLMGAACLSKKQ